MNLNPVRLGLAGGIFWGVSMFIMTLLAVHTGYGRAFMESLTSIYPGYHLTNAGSLVGLIYGFIDGFVSLGILGWLYNVVGCCCKCDSKCSTKNETQYKNGTQYKNDNQNKE